MTKAQKHRIPCKRAIPAAKWHKREAYSFKRTVYSSNCLPQTEDLGGNSGQHKESLSTLQQEQQNSSQTQRYFLSGGNEKASARNIDIQN